MRTDKELMLAAKRTYRLQVMLNAREIAIINAWRFQRRVPSFSEAVRELLRRGQAVTDPENDEAGD